MTSAARPRSRAPRRLLIGLLVLVVLLVVADRGGNYAAEQIAADNLRTSQHLPSQPDVSIGGFPFLTQLAAGRYDHITMDARGVPIGTDQLTLRLAAVHVVLHDLTVSRSFTTFHADTATADARVDYAELGRLLGVSLDYAGDGRVRATKSVTVLGNTVSAGLTARPELANGALSFAKVTINGAQQLSAAVVAVLNKVFDLSIPLDGIPFGVKVRSLQATSSGVHIALSGSDLTYSS